jgi:hypothetical protein
MTEHNALTACRVLGPEPETAPEAPQRLKPLSFKELCSMPPPKYLLKGLWTDRTLAEIYGPPGAGKTFLAIDLMGHVAKGWTWRGHKVRQGAVVYITTEGINFFPYRLRAWRLHFDIPNDEEMPFFTLPEPVDLRDPEADLPGLIFWLQQIPNLRVIVVDILNDALAGGSDNSPEDMGAFIRNFRRLMRETGAAGLALHHSGKDTSKGSRGHSSLLGTLELEMCVEQDKATSKCTAKVTKAKDYEKPPAYSFMLEQVTVGTDDEGEDITSCVAVNCEPDPPGLALTSTQRRAVEMLQNVMACSGQKGLSAKGLPEKVHAVQKSLWRTQADKDGLSEAEKLDDRTRAFRRVVSELKDKGIVREGNGYVWFVKKEMEP